MCTLLDAHCDIAMSYELYPHLLKTDDGTDLEKIAHDLARTESRNAIRPCLPTDHFRTFVIRCERGGLDHRDFAALLLQLIEEGHSCETITGRMRLIELCGEEKMQRVGKKRWGMKCNSAFEQYLSYWPKAAFLNMVRDGRDVLASQLNTGNFDKNPEKIATGWLEAMTRFEKLMKRDDVLALMVRYEELVRTPEAQLRSVCAELGLDFDPSMLKHNELDLTVFKTNHLSRDRVMSEIDTSMIGRWKNDLSPEQLGSFLEVAEACLSKYGYT